VTTAPLPRLSLHFSLTDSPPTPPYTLSLHDALPISHRPGSILWTESRQVFLEGVGSRFPLVAVEFPAGEMQKGMWEFDPRSTDRSEEHTSELQSRFDLVCRLLLEKKKYK